MALSLGAFANRFEIKPLKDQLPIKESELNLMTMRKEMETKVDDKILVASSLKSFIDNDKYVSKKIVELLQYISKEIPKDFHVTDLKIKNNNITILDFPLIQKINKVQCKYRGLL